MKSPIHLYCLLIALCLPSGNGWAQTRGITLETTDAAVSTPFVGGVYRALIIGNDDYRDPLQRWENLDTAVSDARAVATTLQSHYGFSDIELLENATRRDMLKALERLSKRSLPNDSVLIYYAGHGFLDPDSQRGFWVPVDAEGTDSSTFLRNSTIRDELTTIASRARHTLLISDSCFSGTLLRSGTRSITAGERNEAYLKKVSKKKSVRILSAGGLEYVDDNYRDSGHSPFSYFLLNELQHNEREMLTVSELSDNVTRAVANNVEQVPESGVLQGAGDELGEFIFIRLKVSVDGVEPDKLRFQVEVDPADGTVEIEPATLPDDPGRSVPLPTL